MMCCATTPGSTFITEICNSFENENYASQQDCTFSINDYLLNAPKVFSKVRMMWCELESLSLCERTNGEERRLRTELTKYLKAVSVAVQHSSDFIDKEKIAEVLRYVDVTRRTMLPLNEWEGLKVNVKLIGNENSAAYEYFHAFLEMQWMLLLLRSVLEKGEREVGNNFIESVLVDLVGLSKVLYEKNKAGNIKKVAAFPCTCVTKVWINIYLLTEKTVYETNFWELLNQVMKEEEPIFSCWMIYHVANLVDSICKAMWKRPETNHIFLTTKISNLLTTFVEDKDLISCFQCMNPLLNDLWVDASSIEIYQIIWEYYNKHLSKFSNIEDIPKSASKLYELKDKLLRNPTSAENSFEFFLGMLVNHLKTHTNHWLKMKGRIYSRISSAKLNQMDDSSLYKILLMFVLLSSANFEDTMEKMTEILACLPQQRQMTMMIWNFYIVQIALHIDHGVPITKPSEPLLNLISDCHRDNFHLLRTYVNSLNLLTSLSDDFTLNQKILLGPWLKNYMLHCQYSDLDALLETITVLAEKTQRLDAFGDWEPTFRNIVLPALKQTAVAPNATPQVGKLAAVLSAVSSEMAQQVVGEFCGELIAPKVAARFLCGLLQNERDAKGDLVVVAWVRSYLLCGDEELAGCARKIAKIEMVLERCTNFGGGDVLSLIIEVLGKESKEAELRVLFELFFTRLDAWIKPYVTGKDVNEMVVTRIYTYVAQLFRHCSQLLYCKTKAVCLFNRLVNILFLPTEVLKGQKPQQFMLRCVQNNWYYLISGICSICDGNDVFVERVLRDLLTHYVPLFPVQNSPVTDCFNDSNLIIILLSKIANVFFSRNTKCPKTSTIKVLHYLDYYIETTTAMYTIKLIVQKCMTGILEFVLFNSPCNAACSVLATLSTCPGYELVKEDVRQSILEVTDNHLAFYTSNYFELTAILAKIVPEDMRVLLPTIKEHVMDAEKRRGVGHDKVMRSGYDNLKSLLKFRN